MIIKSKQAFLILIKILAISCLFSCKDSNQPPQLLTETAQQNLMAVDSKNDGQAKLKERADAGDANAQRELGTRLLASEKAEDKTDGLNLIKKAATQGNAEAQNQLGNLFFASLTVSQNKEEAFKWYLKAAEQGFTSAQNMIHYMEPKLIRRRHFFGQKNPLYLAMPQDNSILESHILMAMELRKIHKKERSGS